MSSGRRRRIGGGSFHILLGAGHCHDRVFVRLDGRDAHVEIQAHLVSAREQVAARWATVHLPVLPTGDEMRRRAADMFVPEVSQEEVAERARLLLIQAVGARILEPTAA